VGISERHNGWGEQNISSVLKVPRHYPFVLQLHTVINEQGYGLAENVSICAAESEHLR
jgi:hypothetical protein